MLVWPRPAAPIAWIAADGNNAALAVDGRVVVLKPKVRQFASQAWAVRRGLAQPFDPLAEAALAYDCDRSSCLPKAGFRPALGAWWSARRTPTEAQLDALCRASEILVLRMNVQTPPSCRSVRVLRPRDFARGGAPEVYAGEGGWRLDWSQAWRGRRPWSTPDEGNTDADAAPKDAGTGLQ